MHTLNYANSYVLFQILANCFNLCNWFDSSLPSYLYNGYSQFYAFLFYSFFNFYFAIILNTIPLFLFSILLQVQKIFLMFYVIWKLLKFIMITIQFFYIHFLHFLLCEIFTISRLTNWCRSCNENIWLSLFFIWKSWQVSIHQIISIITWSMHWLVVWLILSLLRF